MISRQLLLLLLQYRCDTTLKRALFWAICSNYCVRQGASYSNFSVEVATCSCLRPDIEPENDYFRIYVVHTLLCIYVIGHRRAATMAAPSLRRHSTRLFALARCVGNT